MWFSRRTARAKRCCLLCFFLQNGCSGRGCLNNICIVSYGVGAKFFTTNLMSVDLPQNTPKTRKPIAERTSHGWHGYTHQGVQQSLLHQTAATPPTECTERTETSGREKTPTDSTDEHRLLWCAVLTQNSEYRIWQRRYGRDAIPSYICEHPCYPWESLLYQKVPCVPCVLWEYLFSHGCHGSIQIVRCAVLPQNSRNSQNLAAWVWQECHTLLICEHPCSSVESSSLSEGSVCSVRSVGISFLPRMARMNTDGYGALFSHRIHRIWQRGYGRDAIPS